MWFNYLYQLTFVRNDSLEVKVEGEKRGNDWIKKGNIMRRVIIYTTEKKVVKRNILNILITWLKKKLFEWRVNMMATSLHSLCSNGTKFSLFLISTTNLC